jgi:hypothetical protein
MARLHDTLELATVEDRFVLIANDKSGLQIDRRSGAISVLSNAEEIQGAAKKTVYGILGVVTLLRGRYLIVISQRESVGKILDNDVYKITRLQLLPYNEKTELDAKQEEDEQKYLAMMQTVASLPWMYYSPTLDLTNSFQRQAAETYDKNAPMWKRTDKRFFWNSYLVEELTSSSENLDQWIIPVIMGFVGVSKCTIRTTAFYFGLVSRRNVNRAGTRYNKRGVDQNGNVANNVETEQLFFKSNESNSTLYTYVQTRGSIPLFWSQKVDINYAPKPRLTNFEAAKAAFKKHIDAQQELYGPNVIVCLVNHHGSEGGLHDEYSKHMAELYHDSAHRFVGWDFHKQTKGMKFENLSNLLEEVKKDLNNQGYYCSKTNSKQNGTVRTNCMDNLDRTNVAQGVFAAHVLAEQLRKEGLLNGNETIKDHPAFNHIFMNVWADNADCISTQYAGTGALKTDFTRTGARTKVGLLNDGLNSVTRYVLNNFYDGFKQDSFSLFLGEFKPAFDRPSPFKAAPTMNSTFVFVTCIAFLFFTGVALSPVGVTSWTFKMLVMAAWGGAIYSARTYLKKNGKALVNKPQLVADDE